MLTIKTLWSRQIIQLVLYILLLPYFVAHCIVDMQFHAFFFNFLNIDVNIVMLNSHIDNTQRKCSVRFTLSFHGRCVQIKKANKNLLVQLTKSISKAESSNLSFERYSRDTKERLRGNLHLGCCLLQFNVTDIWRIVFFVALLSNVLNTLILFF